MDIASAFLSALFYYSIISQHTGSEATKTENFHIIEDRATVDKLARKYAKYHVRWVAAIRKNTRISKEKEEDGICDYDPAIKVEFCRRFLPMVHFGYRFKNADDEAFTCKLNTFWTRKKKKMWRRRSLEWKEKQHQLKMYLCPDIFYRDLESDTNVTVDDRYLVSRGSKDDSAIIFFQEHASTSEARINPLKYVENIIFPELIPPRRADADLLPELTSNPIFIEEELIAYERAVKLKKPYDKFRLTFFSVNICGLRKSAKVYLCRESIRAFYGRKSKLRFDQDYDETKCRKRIEMRISIWNSDKFTAGTTKNVRRMKKSESFFKVSEVSSLFLLCPRMLPSNKNDFVYLASNLQTHSVIFHMRTNDPVEYFDVTAIVSDLNMDRIDEHQRRTKVKPYPLEGERQENILRLQINYLQQLEEVINSASSDLRTPTTIAKADVDRLDKLAYTPPPIKLIQKYRLVEDIVIKYSEIKTMKLPYRRFRATHRSLDICELPKIVKVELCRNIASKYPLDALSVDHDTNLEATTSTAGEISDSEIYYTPREQDTDYDEDGRCTNKRISLGIREIENLQAPSFQMWRCPEDRGLDRISNSYIAKSHLKNTALLFRLDDTAENSDDNIYPDALVTEIDRDELALIVLADYILYI